MSFIGNIGIQAEQNGDFRKVIFTGSKSQLVIMSIPAGGEVGTETHDHVEQTLYIDSGTCKVVLDGQEHALSEGDIVVVTPGTEHNFVNVGDGDLKIITTYSPPNHIDGRIHRTKEEADKDTEDEEFGHQYTS